MLAQFISLAALIITLLTAIGTILTVREIKKQRENVYLPDLFISNAYVNFYGFDFNDRFSDFQYERKKNIEKKQQFVNDPSSISPWLYLEMNNIGFGAAKYIEYEWEFDFKKLSDLLISANHNEFIIERRKDAERWDITIETLDKHHFSSEYYEISFLKKNIDFISQSSIAKTLYEIAVPGSYINLISYYVVLKYDMLSVSPKKDFLIDKLSEVPSLFINFKYKDIGNKQHCKRFILNFSINYNQPFPQKRPLFSTGAIGGYSIVTKQLS